MEFKRVEFQERFPVKAKVGGRVNGVVFTGRVVVHHPRFPLITVELEPKPLGLPPRIVFHPVDEVENHLQVI